MKMRMPRASKATMLAALFGVLVLGVAVTLLARRYGGNEGASRANGVGEEPVSVRPPGFVDATAEVGITFRMAFLPGEQGEHFKINLYDHGCGVVVGDYDGDGYD